VKQRGEVPFQNFGFRDFGSRGVELHDIATPEFAKAEKPKLTSYHFRISGFRRPKGGENTKFELWHIELPIREIALTVGSRENPQPLISLKGDLKAEKPKLTSGKGQVI
jgi:hypothetical protein